MNEDTVIKRISRWMEERRSLRVARKNVTKLLLISSTSSYQNSEKWREGVTESLWNTYLRCQNLNNKQEVFSRAYFGGVQHSIRKQVWPYLLEHYEFGSTVEEREAIDHKLHQLYIQTVSEWSEIEEASRQQRDKSVASYMLNISMGCRDGNYTDSSAGSDSEPESIMSISSSNGSVYSKEFLESFGLNLDRIDKDVKRCDRFHPYFHEANLEKLRRVVCTYVFKNLEMGYKQGMCDLAAPLLVLFDNEVMTYACFSRLMNRMASIFFIKDAMPKRYEHMSTLIQIFDPEMSENLRGAGDGECMYFFFCYRWFLLDFKRELDYEDIYNVWEAIWAARFVSSNHFELFIALALVQINRNNILELRMNFTDLFKYFNDLAEKHEIKVVLQIARQLLSKLRTL